jgi:hypothetical protein
MTNSSELSTPSWTPEMELPTKYLTVQTTLEQAVRDNMVNGVPFGHIFEDWQRLLDKRRDGDELWYFEPPDEFSMQLWGVALVREGKVVSTVVTAVD